jgi:hypothetical protein
MAITRTAIANLALRHVGVSRTIANLDAATDRSAQAQAVRDFFDIAVDEVLRDFDWPFARRMSDASGLALVADDPTTEWAYSYRLPDDCLAIRRMLNGSGVRVDTVGFRTPWTLGSDATGLLLYTDYASTSADALRVVYTARVTDFSLWPADAVQSLSLLLGGYIAPSITEGDELKMGERALSKYQWRIVSARVNAANEEQRDEPGDGSLVSARY